MRTVKVGSRDERLTPVYAMAPAPGELPLGIWRLGQGEAVADRFGAHAHEFPLLVYSEGTTTPSSALSLRAGDVVVIAPGTVMGPFDSDHVDHAEGWAVSFSAVSNTALPM